MMNKKGTIKRILLYCLFFCILIFVVYSLVLTFKEINNKNKTKVSNYSSLRMIDENTTYNPLDYIYNYGFLAIKSSSISSTTNNILDYENNSSTYFYNPLLRDSSTLYRYWYNNSSIIVNGSRTPYTENVTKYNGRLVVSSAINGFNNLSNITQNTRNYIINESTSVLGSSKSFLVYFDCNINADMFTFDFYYNLPLQATTRSIYFYVVTDAGSYNFSNLLKFSNTSNIASFNSSDLLAAIPGATYVKRFGFATAQSSVTSGIYSGYLPIYNSDSSSITSNYYSNNGYSNYYNSLSSVADKYNLMYLVFHDSNYSESYINGYNDGYNTGLNYNQNYISSLSSQVNELNNSISNLQTTINNQAQIISNLQAQLNQSQNNFKDLFFTFTDIPIKTIHDILNFDFFGLNLFRFFTGVLTALGAIWLIKKFI